jgi:radical SAM superfamily enzyme YgiQ (UPF0313 family)
MQKKILLALAPFWPPLSPPLGISCLKSYLSQFGYDVAISDMNTTPVLWNYRNEYLSKLSNIIPVTHHGNFNMSGDIVLMNHLMIYLNNDNDSLYKEIIKVLIKCNFYYDINTEDAVQLHNIIDNFYSEYEKQLKILFNKHSPEIFGLTVYNNTLAPSLFAYKLIKKLDPEVMTIMGGGIFADQLAFGSINLEKFLLRTPYIDKIVIGEGELVFKDLLEGTLPEDQRIFTKNDIDQKIMDLTKATCPDFDDLEVEQYSQLASYTSRSCPFQCSFCSETVQWGKYRKKNPRQIVSELSNLNSKYNSQLFLFGDSLINPIISGLSEEIIDRVLSIYWDGYLRVNSESCNINNTIKWRKGGFYRARLGVESGSSNVLKLMNKKITPEQIKSSVISLANAGIKTTTYWVVGHPGETERDFQETLELISDLSEFIYEADWHPVFYYPTGQSNSEKWSSDGNLSLLYPEKYSDMLLTQTWIMKSYPEREIVYERLSRFAGLCNELSIPNPYTLLDIYNADKRWQKLHKNSVPPLIKFHDKNDSVNENNCLNEFAYINEAKVDEGDFNFE